MRENDATPVRGPIEFTRTDSSCCPDMVVTVCKLPRHAVAIAIFMDWDQMQMIHLCVLINPARIIFSLLILKFLLGFCVSHGIGDRLPIWRPLECDNVRLEIGELLGLATGNAQHVQVIPTGAFGRKSQELTVW